MLDVLAILAVPLVMWGTVVYLLVSADRAAGLIPGRRRRGWLDRHTAERVIVHTTEDQTLDGLLREVTRDGLVLATVTLVDHAVDVAGDVWVPREKVAMIQRPPS